MCWNSPVWRFGPAYSRRPVEGRGPQAAPKGEPPPAARPRPRALRDSSRWAVSTSPRTGLPVTTQLTELSKYRLASGTASITALTDFASILVVTPG